MEKRKHIYVETEGLCFWQKGERDKENDRDDWNKQF